jgi:hypothetical protein
VWVLGSRVKVAAKWFRILDCRLMVRVSMAWDVMFRV